MNSTNTKSTTKKGKTTACSTTAKKVGRPAKVNDSVVAKLETAFAMGCTDVEACLFAGISKDALYNYIKRNPPFADRKEALKRNPIMTAKGNVVNALNDNDIETSKWYLERRCKEEFSKTENISVAVSENIEKGIDTLADSIKQYLSAD